MALDLADKAIDTAEDVKKTVDKKKN
jgi:hypothetical protein